MNQVLVITGEQSVKDTLVEELSKEGYDTLSADNSEEGLQVFHAKKPSAVILDLDIPVMNGHNLLEGLRHETGDPCSVVVLTEPHANGKIEHCYGLGIHRFLRKPVNPFELRGTIKHCLAESTATSELRCLNKRLTSLAREIPCLVWECDAELNITYITDNVEEILGYSSDHILGKPITDFLAAENVLEFFLKVKTEDDEFHEEVQDLSLTFMAADETPVPMQLSARRLSDEQGISPGMMGIARDMRAFQEVITETEKLSQEMNIQVNEQLCLIYAHESVHGYLPFNLEEEEKPPSFSQFICDSSMLPLFSFAFDQREDIAFPVEVKLVDPSGLEHFFNVQFQYQEDGPCLEGSLVPLGAENQIAFLAEKSEQAVQIDSEMQEDILTDSNNLAAEIFNLTKSLTVFAYGDPGPFVLGEFNRFIEKKKMYLYLETLQLLGNKLHGLKGAAGFLIPEAKQLCHHMEDITRPLAECELVYTERLAALLRQFVFKLQEMLEQYQDDPDYTFQIDNWVEKITEALENETAYLGEDKDAFSELLHQRSSDSGEIRKRKEDDSLSVSRRGYELLSQHARDLFYHLSQQLSGDILIQASDLYNRFLSTHGDIRKLPLDLSRYERLIPSLAEQYNKKADFLFNGYGVRADRQFWDATHEILNHSLKNAVIHGLEQPEEREEQGKKEAGLVLVETKEDALHIYLSVSDDGRGIDVDKIREKALENHVISPEQVQSMSAEDILDLTFVQGVSTAEALDDNAGRGVGMTAVGEAMRCFRGRCRISTNLGKGTTYDFTFPKKDVSLPIIVVTVGNSSIAIPEERVDVFYSFDKQQIVDVNQEQTYPYNEKLIPFQRLHGMFGEEERDDEQESIMVLDLRDGGKLAIVINRILHHLTMPVLPMPKVYERNRLYIGTILLGNEPVLVLDVDQIKWERSIQKLPRLKASDKDLVRSPEEPLQA